MFHNIADDITLLLTVQKKIDIDEREIYTYGLEVILLNGLLMIVFLIISILTKTVNHFILYVFFFIPLRKFSGGYHAETSEKCFIYSIVMYFVSIFAVKIFPFMYNSWLGLMLGIISILITIIFAPLINPNNPLNDKQIKRNRIITFILLLIDLVSFILFYCNDWKSASNILVFVILSSILLVLGKLNNKL